MYSFIFYFFLKVCEKVGTIDPKDNAATLSGIVIFFHIFCFFNAITYFTGTNLLASLLGEHHNRYYYLPVVILFMILLYRFYRKKADAIILKYNDRQNILSWINILVVIAITIGPLLLGIWFLNND